MLIKFVLRDKLQEIAASLTVEAFRLMIYLSHAILDSSIPIPIHIKFRRSVIC